MAEPVTLYKNDEEMTVHAPSEAQRLQAEGWSVDRPATDDPDAQDGLGGLSEHVRAVLLDAGLADADAVQGASDSALLKLPGIGRKTLAEIREAIG